MTQTSISCNSDLKPSSATKLLHDSSKMDNFATGVATGVAVTVIVETGKSAVKLLLKNPLVVLGAGIVTGYYAHKYRKEIVVTSHKVAHHTQDFVARQKLHLAELLNENDKV